MKITGKIKSNNVDVYLSKVELQDNIIGHLLSVATSSSPSQELESLMRLLQGKLVDVRIFNSTNVVGNTNTKDIMSAWDDIPEVDKKMFWQLDEKGDSKILKNVINKFGDGKLGFQARIKISEKEILSSINHYNEELLFQGLDVLLNSHFSIKENSSDVTINTYETDFETYEREAFNEIDQNEVLFEPIEFSFNKNKHDNILQILRAISDFQDNEIAFHNIIDYPAATSKEIQKVKKARNSLSKIIDNHIFPLEKEITNTI